jgi:hypothetical protein
MYGAHLVFVSCLRYVLAHTKICGNDITVILYVLGRIHGVSRLKLAMVRGNLDSQGDTSLEINDLINSQFLHCLMSFVQQS